MGATRHFEAACSVPSSRQESKPELGSQFELLNVLENSREHLMYCLFLFPVSTTNVTEKIHYKIVSEFLPTNTTAATDTRATCEYCGRVLGCNSNRQSEFLCLNCVTKL
jgi:hypothetical protein